MAHASRTSILHLSVCALALAPHFASAQGRCGGERAGTPACDTTPAKAPFAPTGWKTVALDHFGMQAVDYKKEAAYYATLMNWTVRSDDGSQAVLDAGDVGRVIIRGGFQAPPPPRRRPAPVTAADSATARARAARPPRNVVWIRSAG